MGKLLDLARFAVPMAGLLVVAGCGRGAAPDDGRIKISYWEKWTGFEGEAIAAVVQAFNEKPEREADKIEVELTTVSQIERKLLVAVAGADPPDVAGLYTWILYSYADKGALTDLTPMLKEAGIGRDDYIPVYWDICEHRDKMWALPTTPATVALHWNKRLFREAGLDPSRPPQTIAELDEMAEKLTTWKKGDEVRTGPMPEGGDWTLLQIGFLPQEPGWWAWSWGFWSGGEVWDGKGTITANSDENVKGYEWVRSYTRKYGKQNLEKFSSGFGNFSSPQNAFLCGKVAMEIQGVWMHNFIEKYAPGMEWAAAPFPSRDPATRSTANAVTNVEADVIIIPAGSRHPREAFKFIQFVNSREGMEILCSGHRKFSPLSDVSPGFSDLNPPANPHLDMFRDLSFSPNLFTTPKLGMWSEYRRELGVAFDRVRGGTATEAEREAGKTDEPTVREIMGDLQERMQRSLERELRRKKLREERNET